MSHYQWYKCCAAFTMDLPINPLKINFVKKNAIWRLNLAVLWSLVSMRSDIWVTERIEWVQKFYTNDLSLPMPFLLKIGQSKFPLWHNPVKSQKYCTCVSQIRVVIRYHYDISGLNVPQTSFLWGDQRWHSEMSTHYTNTKVGIDGKTWS